MQTSGAWRREARMCVWERGGAATTIVMPGLDPGIHPSSQEAFSKKMDCRVKPGNDDTVDNSPNTWADIRSHERYINPARHRVRAFGVGWIWQNDGIDTIERRPRRPPQAAVVSLLASGHPRNGPYSRPLCRRRDRNPHRCRIGAARASDRGARPRPL